MSAFFEHVQIVAKYPDLPPLKTLEEESHEFLTKVCGLQIKEDVVQVLKRRILKSAVKGYVVYREKKYSNDPRGRELCQLFDRELPGFRTHIYKETPTSVEIFVSWDLPAH